MLTSIGGVSALEPLNSRENEDVKLKISDSFVNDNTTKVSINSTNDTQFKVPSNKFYNQIKKSYSNTSVRSNGMYNITTDYLNYSETLTTTDTQDYYFFTLDTAKNIYSRIISSNTNYMIAIASTDTGKPIENYGLLSGSMWNYELPAGNYAFVVMPVDINEEMGSTYTIQANLTSPAGQSVLYNTNSTNTFLSMKYVTTLNPTTGDIYSNDKKILDKVHANTMCYSSNAQLGYWTHISHLYRTNIKSVSTPIKYTSDAGSSNNAVIITVNPCAFALTKFYYTGNPNDGTEEIQDPDVAVKTDTIFIYDINTGKVLDCISDYNYFYKYGKYSTSHISYSLLS